MVTCTSSHSKLAPTENGLMGERDADETAICRERNPPRPKPLAPRGQSQRQTDGKPGSGRPTTVQQDSKLAVSAAARKEGAAQPTIPGCSYGEWPSRTHRQQWGKRHDESQRGGPSGTLQPASALEGDLIDLGTTKGDGAHEKLQDAITNFRKMVSSRRQRRPSNKTDKTDKTDDSVQEQSVTHSEGYAIVPHAGRESSSATDSLCHTSSDNSTPETSPGIICTECKATFSSVPDLHEHQKSAEHNYCRLCFGHFADGSVLAWHNELVHNFGCVECMEKFTSTAKLMEHQREEDHCFCATCDCFFTTKESKDAHASKVHSVSECSSCVVNLSTISWEERELPERVAHYSSSISNDTDEEADNDDVAVVEPATAKHLHKCDEANCSFSGSSAEELQGHQREEGHRFCVLCNSVACDVGEFAHGQSRKTETETEMEMGCL